MKMEVNFPVSKHELKPFFIGSYMSNVSENSRYYASALGFRFLQRHRMRDFVLKKHTLLCQEEYTASIMTHMAWNGLFNMQFTSAIVRL